jgi:ATP-binding cassette subfamily C exporter for protease/lipase
MNPQKPISELQKALTSLRPSFKKAALYSFIAGLLVLAPSIYMLEVYERVVNSRSHMTLAMLTVWVLGTYVFMEVLEWVRAEILHEASHRFDQEMSARVFYVIFEANLKRQPGGTAQPMGDFRVVRDFFYHPFVLSLLESPVSLVLLLVIFAISPILGWTAVAAALLQFLIGWLNERKTQPPLTEANRSATAAQQYADGTLRNAQVIEAMGMLRSIRMRWQEKQDQFINFQKEASNHAGFYQAAGKFLQNTVSSMLLGLGAWLLLRDNLNGGPAMMIVASIIGGRVLAPLIQMVTHWQAVINFRAAYNRLDNLLNSLPPTPTGMTLPAPQGHIIVENLMASAPGSQSAILRGITFALQPGDVLAVVGPSASGKTTLARLLMGIWPALAGKVRLDGADVFTWNKSELGPHVGYLPQGVELFEGTLAENIARFDTPDIAKVEAAARAVGLHDFIQTLPETYNTQIGDAGAILSGGQRQRVALARAIYGKPAFVVLDEPNSSLDEQGEAALSSAISRCAAQGTTFVVITHRTSVLSVANKMLVLKDGQTQYFGPRDDVLKAINEAVAKARQPAAVA